MNGPALKIHAGFTGHSALQLLVWQVVAPAVLDEHGAGLDKAEGHVGIHAFLPERLDPIEIAGSGTIIVFAAADDLLDLPGGKVLPDAYWPDEGRAHDALVLEGQVKQDGNALIGTALILTGDIEKDADIEIFNPEQVIATLAEGGSFNMEMTIANGRGYTRSEENKETFKNNKMNVIAVDSLYSPIERINYEVESARVGQNNNFDKLILEVWTNGSITPEEAISLASNLLK